jgi:hypothetical protein
MAHALEQIEQLDLSGVDRAAVVERLTEGWSAEVPLREEAVVEASYLARVRPGMTIQEARQDLTDDEAAELRRRMEEATS